MFGYLVADIDSLSKTQKEKYKGCYCGLCHSLNKTCGKHAKLVLSYDIVFLVMLLTSLYNKEYILSSATCSAHFIVKKKFFVSQISQYGANINTVLSYYNFLDNVIDEDSILSKKALSILEDQFRKASGVLGEKADFIEEMTKEIRKIEEEKNPSLDEAAKAFGKLLGELFVIKDDIYTARLKAFGDSLGRFIYTIDAASDIQKDKKNGAYNPFLLQEKAMHREDIEDILYMLMANVKRNFDALDIKKDKEILENILYKGSWIKYNITAHKTNKLKRNVPNEQ